MEAIAAGDQRPDHEWLSVRGSGWCPSCTRMEQEQRAMTEASWLVCDDVLFLLRGHRR
jgi:hypothetical protein